MGILIFLLVLGVLLYKGWSWLKKQDYALRLAIKIVLVYLSGGFALLMLMVLLVAVGGIFKSSNEDSLAYRLMEVERYMEEGDYHYVEVSLRVNEDYEPEFDYAWERVAMYKAYNQCVLFVYADANENLTKEKRQMFANNARNYGERLREICKESTLEENVPYKEFYLRKLEQMGLFE